MEGRVKRRASQKTPYAAEPAQRDGPKPIVYDGTEFPTISALIRKFRKDTPVSTAVLRARLWRGYKRWGEYQEDWLSDALFMTAIDFKRKYGARRTVTEIAGEKRNLSEVFAALPEKYVTWTIFRRRLRRFKGVSYELACDAARMTRADWISAYGGGRRREFTYCGELHPHACRKFSSFTSFLKAIERYADRNLLHDRMKAGWDIDDALLRSPITRGKNHCIIYKIQQRSTGRCYIGTTVRGCRSRWAEHVRCALSQTSSTLLHREIRSAGDQDFTIEVIEDGIMSTGDQAERERFWIEALRTLAPNGLNTTRGGTLGRKNGQMIELRGHVFLSIAQAARTLSESTSLPTHVIEARIKRSLPLSGRPRTRSVHPEAGSPLFRKWKSMLKYSAVNEVSCEWMDFDRWKQQTSAAENIDRHLLRPDVTLPWGPSNFLWGSSLDKVKISHGSPIAVDGVKYQTVRDACAAHSIAQSTFRQRISRGMSVKDAFTLRPRARRQ